MIFRPVKTVLLINPPGVQMAGAEPKKCTPPMGLLSLASYLLSLGYNVQVLDAVAEGFDNEEHLNDDLLLYGLSCSEIRDRILKLQPDLVGIGCPFSCRRISFERTAHVVKEIDKAIPVLAGGAHPSMAPAETLANPDIDFVVLGEGEFATAELLSALCDGKSLESIAGIGYRAEGAARIQPQQRYIDPLDPLPFPARQLVDFQRYSDLRAPHGDLMQTPYSPVITSRGCPGRCIFCVSSKLWGPRFRPRSANNVLSEFRELATRYQIREIHFEDDNLTCDRERAAEIFNGMIREKMEFLWATPNGLAVNTLDEELLDLMRASGCYSISLAIESGSKEVLERIIHKPVSLTRARRIRAHAKSLGIRVTGFFIIGFPGETKAQIQETVGFAEGLDLDNAGLLIAAPYPGTELLAQCTAQSCLTSQPANLDYLRLRHSRGAHGVIRTAEFNPEYLNEVVNQFDARQKERKQNNSALLKSWRAL